MSEGLDKEINKLPSLSVFQLRTRLILCYLLYFLNSDLFTFGISIVSFAFPLFFIPFNFWKWLIIFCFHYFVFWRKLKPLLDKKFQTKKDLEETKELIKAIKSELKFRL
jgi:hypothetical protein